VSDTRPLRLKTETAKRVERSAADLNPVARVWVDNSVAHLDGVYDYLVPARLDSEVTAGIRVSVDFNGRDCEAIVLERVESEAISGLKFISKVISPVVVAPEGLLKLIEIACSRWLAHPYDFLRSAIPPRAAGVDKGFSETRQTSQVKNGRKSSVTFIHVQPHEDPIAKLAEFAAEKSKSGSVLIITPEERELQVLAKLLGDSANIISASLSRTERYKNYLRSISESRLITIGTRSAIFLYPPDLQSIIVFREGAQSHYEPRSPGWNTREIALLRGQESGCDLFFVGFSPSLETGLAIEKGETKFLSKSNRLKVSNFESVNGELLPNRIFSPIRRALKEGPVLFLVPRKGYANSLMCKKCRNLSVCTCGGKMSKGKANSAPECVLCGKRYPSLKCQWCQSDAMIMLGRGGERHTEEIGRAFPNHPTYFSSAENPISDLPNSSALVISTAGMEPRVPGGYASVVLLEGDSFFSYSDLRAQERARETFFGAASMVSKKGEVLTVVNSSNAISSALAQWSPKTLLLRELAERQEVGFPPFSRCVAIEIDSSEATTIVAGLKKALLEKRLPSSAKVLGPTQSSAGKSRILITADLPDSQGLLTFLGAYIRHRAINKKKSISYRVDPYSLT
jgi:primosomal protein N' (replication factor Y) (superfamily II helicase)